jgi:flagellar biosynthetic protein FlhB
MAENDRHDRTESPTQKRLDEARKKGQVPRSRDLNAAAVVLTGGLGLYGLGGIMGGRLQELMRSGLSLSAAQSNGPDAMLQQLAMAAWQGGLAAVPLLGLLLAAAVIAPLAIGGWTFSAEVLVPDFTRLNPAAGLGRVFSLRGLFELLKTLARCAVIGVIAAVLLWVQFPRFSALARQSAGVGVAHSLSLCGTALIALACGMALIAIIDVPLALWQHDRALRMTREEVREEAKESDGHPEVRGRIRRAQRDLANRRMMQEVPKADVVITNPTHYAVALRYDEKRMRAPVVVAKGADYVAQRIREIATEHRVALVEAPPLARALHAHCELGDEIPARLYAAVAKVLTYVYQLRTARRRGTRPPEPPQVQVPEGDA